MNRCVQRSATSERLLAQLPLRGHRAGPRPRRRAARPAARRSAARPGGGTAAAPAPAPASSSGEDHDRARVLEHQPAERLVGPAGAEIVSRRTENGASPSQIRSTSWTGHASGSSTTRSTDRRGGSLGRSPGLRSASVVVVAGGAASLSSIGKRSSCCRAIAALDQARRTAGAAGSGGSAARGAPGWRRSTGARRAAARRTRPGCCPARCRRRPGRPPRAGRGRRC